MTHTLRDRVIVVGGGTGLVGRAVTGALLAAGARVIVPARREEDAERFYLEADPETVPRLRTAVGDYGDPAMPGRIAAVAKREFGGIDHLVSAIGSAPLGPLDALDARAVQQAMDDDVSAPGRFVLGMLRHLNGAAPVKRVVVVTPAPGADAKSPPDAWSLGRTFLEGLVGLLRESKRAGVEFYALRVPRVTGLEAGAGAIGSAVARLLADGVRHGAGDLFVELVAPDDIE